MFKNLVAKTRSVRRYDESFKVSEETLRSLVDLARLSPSPANLQALKFKLVFNAELVMEVFRTVRFGGYFKDWGGPQPGERPAAYIVILGDLNIKQQFDLDAGIAAQSMMLGLTDLGLGGCMVGSFDHDALKRLLVLSEDLVITLVLAIGKPAEQIVIDEMTPGGSVKYYRDEQNVHHVPKRALDELII